MANDRPSNRLDLMTPAERSCRDAVAAIEIIGADPRLTRAQNLIQEAQVLVYEWTEEQRLTGKLDIKTKQG